MGLYDYVYSCGCVECDSTLNGNQSKMPPYLILVCSDHKLMIGINLSIISQNLLINFGKELIIAYV